MCVCVTTRGGLPSQPPYPCPSHPLFFFSLPDTQLFIRPHSVILPLCELQSHIDSLGHFLHNSYRDEHCVSFLFAWKWCEVVWLSRLSVCFRATDGSPKVFRVRPCLPWRGGVEASLAGFMVCNCVLGRLCPLFLPLMAVCVLFLVADLCMGGAQGEALIYCQMWHLLDMLMCAHFLPVFPRWSCSLAGSPACCRNCVSCRSSTSATHTSSKCSSPHSSAPASTTSRTKSSCSRRWAACSWPHLYRYAVGLNTDSAHSHSFICRCGYTDITHSQRKRLTRSHFT